MAGLADLGCGAGAGAEGAAVVGGAGPLPAAAEGAVSAMFGGCCLSNLAGCLLLLYSVVPILGLFV